MNARITVVKKPLNMDLICAHFPEAARAATACPDFQVGQSFEVPGSNIACSEGFCDVAWMTLERIVTRACNGEKLLGANAFPSAPMVCAP
jgi:uncharacterized repeat protein (TIGR04076 family)